MEKAGIAVPGLKARDGLAAINGSNLTTGMGCLQIYEAERLLKLEDRLHLRIVSQQEAVSAVARAVRRSRSGLKDPNRPMGSFIFVGPSGVGKSTTIDLLREVKNELAPLIRERIDCLRRAKKSHDVIDCVNLYRSTLDIPPRPRLRRDQVMQQEDSFAVL